VRDAVLAVGGVGAARVDAQQFAVRDRQVLRVGVAVAEATLADGEVEVAVVGVAALGDRVEVDLLDAVDLAAEADPQHLAMGTGECVRGRVGGLPLVDDTVVEDVGLPVVRDRGAQRRIFGVDGVEEAVALEARMERDEPEALTQAAAGEELRLEGRGDVEVDVRHPVLHEVQVAVQVGHGAPARAVRHLHDGVDPGDPVESLAARRRVGERFREARVLGEHQTELRGLRFGRDRIANGAVRGLGRRRQASQCGQ
jgi:hypothetical protein